MYKTGPLLACLLRYKTGITQVLYCMEPLWCGPQTLDMDFELVVPCCSQPGTSGYGSPDHIIYPYPTSVRVTDIVLGMGEVGSTIFDLIERRGCQCVGVDEDPARSRNHTGMISNPDFLHVCIPGDLKRFTEIVLEYAKRYKPRAILVHSTVRPGTAAALQAHMDIPVVSAPTRGVHHRFLYDMERYTKFVACDIPVDPEVVSHMERRFVKMQWMSTTKTAELAKLLTDTTYYGWLINYSQITAMICQKEQIDYEEMWIFADEIQEYLGNRPKMFPGVIGGHCVIPNLALIDYEELQAVKTINDVFREHIQHTDATAPS